MTKRILVLFSGTGSVEKVFNDWDFRGLDLDNRFNPYYNVNILKWDYKTELKDWIPDFIWGSPVCCEFSNLKHVTGKRDMGLGMSLLLKTIEIIEWVKTINPDLKFTMENPKGLMRKQECMKPYEMVTTSYCMYGYPYQKDTDFWFGGYDLELKCRCKNSMSKKDWCEGKKEFNCHRVRLGLGNKKDTGSYKRTNKNQIGDGEYFKELKKTDQYKNGRWTNTYFRYRIPSLLLTDVKKSVEGCDGFDTETEEPYWN